MRKNTKYVFILVIVAFAIIVIDSGVRSVVTSPFILFDAKDINNSSERILTGYAGTQGDFFLKIGETESINGVSPVEISLGDTLYNYYDLGSLQQDDLFTGSTQLDVVTRKGISASFGERTDAILESNNVLFNRYQVQVKGDNPIVPFDLQAEYSSPWIIIVLSAGIIIPALYLLLINITYVKLNPNSNFSLLELFFRFFVPYLLAFILPIVLNYYFVFGPVLLLTKSYLLGLLISILLPVIVSVLLTTVADDFYQKMFAENREDLHGEKEDHASEEIVFFTMREKLGNLVILVFLFVDVYITKYVLPIQIQSMIFYDLFWFFVWTFVLFVIMFVGFHYIQYFTGNYRKANSNERIYAGISDVEKKLQTPVHLMVKKDTKEDYNAWVYVLNSFSERRLYIYVTEGLFKKFNTKEIASILYHEIGHIKLHHMRYVMLLSSAIVLLTGVVIFFGRKMSLASGWYQYLFIFIVVILLGILIQQWIPSFVSKKLEHKADAYAVRLMEDKHIYINALNKITELHDEGSESRSRKEWRESHPSLKKRIEYLNKI
ncbi:M48 family metallopeptidase [Alkalihalobacillus hemicellulosilyticus]|uniref:M48 family metallopeptidase n=1 Tax=Halalkalibacter hemicellulosilyticus TaxID=127886 RepID=UPI0011DCF6F2|nr:M48 family metallopeptidase [Halalkalibacter hemicellulosilyticus]